MDHNVLTDAELAQMVAQASTLAERLGRALPGPGPAAVDAPAAARLDKWRQSVGKGDAAKFARRLALDGLDLPAATRALGVPPVADPPALPAWTATIQAYLQAVACPAAPAPATPDAPALLPFAEILAPLVALAGQQLEQQAAGATGLLAPPAQVALRHSLLKRLSQLAAPTLYDEFVRFRDARRAAGDLPPAGDGCYQAFVATLRAGDLARMLQHYPVLARLLALATDQWVAATGEFLARLAADGAAIGQVFLAGDPLEPVVDVDAALSDPHRGGRGVYALTFASGRRLIYKPKDLGTEAAFYQLLDWLNAAGAPLPLQVVRVLNRATYGWVEYVAAAPCADAAAAARFYRRAGALIGVVYALAGTDCHQENLIAAGEHPVLIDTEMLMYPPLVLNQEPGTAATLIQGRFFNSVLHSGLLPAWNARADGKSFDRSGFGGSPDQETPYQVPIWRDVNSDAMTLTYDYEPTPRLPNLPTLDGAVLSIREYVPEVVQGFREMYGLLVAQRAAILAPGGPLAPLADQQVRFIFRSTRVYLALLARTRQPRFMRDGIDRSLEFEVLSRALVASEPVHPCWPLLRYEQQALEQLDVPMFTFPTAGDSLPTDAGPPIAHLFAKPGYELAVTRLRGLDEADLAHQIGLIRAALYARFMGAGRTPAGPGGAPDLPPPALLTPAAAVSRARAIAQAIAARAIRSSEGASWVEIEVSDTSEQHQVWPLGPDLYQGTSGIALFLAAFQHVTGDPAFAELAAAALTPVRRRLRSPAAPALLDEGGIGGAVGAGALLYTLVRVAGWLDDPGWLEDAEIVARLLTPARIAGDSVLDLMGGAAGALLGLLAYYEATGATAAREQAAQCGQHLLARQVASPAGPPAWPTLGGALLTGFSHGAAGIAYACLRLYARIPDPAYLDAARAGIAYEQAVFVPAAGNWPDLRLPVGAQPTFMNTWCHGAPGIGLGRIAGLPLLDTPAIRAEIEAALQSTLASKLHGVDHLCCGNFGRIEVLLTAGRQLARPALVATAHEWAARLVARADQAGGFYFAPELPPDIAVPGFFRGTAGVGYELLRLAYPDQLPAVLLWA